MNFTRPDYVAEVARLRGSRRPDQRAMGDNFAFEENLGPDRVKHFEKFVGDQPGLIPNTEQYFFEAVQGQLRSHVPVTFQPINSQALMSAGIEPNQTIARIECIDTPLVDSGTDYAALAANPRDPSLSTPLLRAMNQYAGARPAFACFRAELADDLTADDWLPRLIARLGLGHFAAKRGETKRFALMKYLAKEVVDSTHVKQPFAIPTVLESRCNEFFCPAPPGPGVGYAVDLDAATGRGWVREFLHMRVTWKAEHLDRLGAITGPTPPLALAAARDAHIGRLRTAADRPNYGEDMSPHVDS